MPTRYLKPGIRNSERIEAIQDPDAEILFYRLLIVVDDFGRTDARPLMVKSACFPIRLRVNADNCMQWLQMLDAARLIGLYEVDGKPYLQIAKWDNKPRAVTSKFPDPSADVYKRMQMLPVTVTVTVTETVNRKPKPETETTTRPHAAKKINGYAFELPADIDAGLWSEFVEMRQKIRKPATDRAKWLIIGKLANIEAEHGHQPRKVLQQSIRNSWQDVFPLRDEGRK